MPRKLYFQAASLPVQVIQRGNNRQACFFAGEDYRLFLEHLAKLAKRFKCSVHAYVLMTNHFHLLLTSELDNGASLLMRFLGQRYVRYLNRVHKRAGSLWEGFSAQTWCRRSDTSRHFYGTAQCSRSSV